MDITSTHWVAPSAAAALKRPPFPRAMVITTRLFLESRYYYAWPYQNNWYKWLWTHIKFKSTHWVKHRNTLIQSHRPSHIKYLCTKLNSVRHTLNWCYWSWTPNIQSPGQPYYTMSAIRKAKKCNSRVMSGRYLSSNRKQLCITKEMKSCEGEVFYEANPKSSLKTEHLLSVIFR